MLDSGAEITVAGPRFQKLIDCGKIKSRELAYKIRTADGAIHTTKRVVVLPIYYQETRHTIEAPLLTSLKRDLVLGIDFWRTFGIRPSVVEVGSIESEKCINVTDSLDLSLSEAEKLQTVLKEMPFCEEGLLSKTPLMKHSIDTGDTKPIRQTQYIISPYVQKEVHAEIDRLLAIGAIFPCSSPWNNPVIAVRKPTGKIRLCVDARKLNAVTVKDAYPQPKLSRILGQLTGTYVLSSIDFSDAYHQVELDEESKLKTAFSVSGKGFFAYARMPFGLCNSGATLCRLVDQVLGCDLEPHVFVYMDDIIIATRTIAQHLEILGEVAKRLKNAGLTISPQKSRFCMRQLKYLGYIIGNGGTKPDPSRISAITEYPAPKTQKDVRRLLGMAEWYRRFIPNYATISAPLSDLLKKGRSFEWSQNAEAAFENIKKALVAQPILQSANYDEPFIIQTDASDSGIGGILVQGSGDEERVVAYYSQKLSAAQKKYQTTERECLAVIVAIEKFRPYVEGVHFTVVTDHASLLWLQNLKDPSGRLARWALRLQPYDFRLIHRAGRLMVVADALSRAVESIDVTLFAQSDDRWYARLIEKVKNEPSQYASFRIEDNVLYKQCSYRPNHTTSADWRIVVPKDKRLAILKQCHDDPLSAHGGRHKTIDRVSREYYWPKMYEYITRYVQKCEVCCATKASNTIQRTPMGDRIVADHLWQTIYIDFVGPLPRSKGGFSYLLVVVDAFSKFVHIHPLRVATAKGVIRFLQENIFLKFGVPDQIVSDNGSQFVSSEYQTFLKQYGVHPFYVSRYHPQANAAEAANKTIGNAIRAYVKSDHRLWDQHISKIACAMNTSAHSSTKLSPYYVNFGRDMVTVGNSHRLKDADAIRTIEHFAKLRSTVSENLLKAHESSKQRYDLRSRPRSFAVGETVWKRTFPLSDASKGYSSKLAPKYIKCIVKKKLGSNSYELSNENGKSIGIFSTKDLKSYVQ